MFPAADLWLFLTPFLHRPRCAIRKKLADCYADSV